MTDHALMLAVRSGDLAKLGMLFERHHGALFDFLARMTGDRASAEDLVQDIFVRIMKYRATYRDEGSFETWMYRIARNARADYFKRRGPLEPLSEDTLNRPDHAEGPGRQVELRRDAARLRKALLQLREDRRELIVMARYREMSHSQIAAILGIEIGAVKVRIHRAMRELREIFLQLQGESPSCDVKTSTHTLQIF